MRLLAAGTALSMLSLSVAVTGAGASSDVTTVAELETALCDGDGTTVALTGDIDESSPDGTTQGSILTLGTSTTTCTASLDLNGRELRLERIIINADSSLTIADGSEGSVGELHAAPVGNNVAGILTTGATLVISGGVVTASGGGNGAGIGGGLSGAGGEVTISGGTVIATGGSSGAGIGGGSGGTGGDVTISGGDVTATAGNFAAGIGGGNGRGGGEVTISGGVVTANGAGFGAGIGGGNGRDGGEVTITGGVVNATGGSSGAGIGGSSGGSGGHVTISGGEVTATGGNNGAGIGGSNGGSGGHVTISGAVVTALGGMSGAGIGGGSHGDGGSVTISGGEVTATAGHSLAQAIGHGRFATEEGTLEVSGDPLSDEEDTTGGGLPRRTIIFAAPLPPTALSLVTQPSGAVVGAPLGVQPVVRLVDAAGVAVVQSGVEVLVAVASGEVSLGGVTSVVTGADGLAVFSGLSIDAEGEHTLEFTADGLEPVTSGTVVVGGGAVSGHPGVTVEVEASPLLVSVADAEVAFTVTAGTVLDGGPNGVDVAARRETAITFNNPVGSASEWAKVEVEFAAVPEALSATSAGSVPDRELELHLWVEPPATAAFTTPEVSWGAAADGAQVLVSGIGQGLGVQSGLTMWWGLSGQTGAGTGEPVTVGTVTFTITDDDG